jgi:hypothetical protein
MAITDNDLVMQNIFGTAPKEVEQEVEEQVVETPEEVEKPPVETPVETPEAPVETPVPPVEKQFSADDLKDEQFIDLINKKFNTKFDTIETANDFFSKQVSYRNQEKIIEQLVNTVKEKSNVLSHFPSENSYKAAQLAKDYPGKEAAAMKIVSANIDAMPDFEAIRLAEELKRSANSRVDPLRFKLSQLGLRDLDIADFEEWDEADKELVYGTAEDAKAELLALQGKYKVPSTEEQPTGLDFISDYERGVQEQNEKAQRLIDEATPIAQTMVNSLIEIKPVEGSDFKYVVNLDNESKSDLVDFLVSEAASGEYDLRSDSSIRELNSLLVQEIWATDGIKIAEAYAKAKVDAALEEAARKYENWTPLGENERKAPKDENRFDDNEAAKRLLGR